MWLIEEAEVEGIGRRLFLWCGFKDGVKAYDGRCEILGNERIADSVAVDVAVGIENIEGGGVAGDRIEWEASVDISVPVGPLRAVGIDVGSAEVVKKRQGLHCLG